MCFQTDNSIECLILLLSKVDKVVKVSETLSFNESNISWSKFSSNTPGAVIEIWLICFFASSIAKEIKTAPLSLSVFLWLIIIFSEFRIKFPNAYYVGLGSLYVPPLVHFKICEENCEQKEYHTIELGKGIPFRTLTYPSPPSNRPRDSPLFYHCGKNKLPIRTQEQVWRNSGYPEDKRMPDDFWGLKPPM